MMAMLIGAGLAALASIFGHVARFDRDRAFYPIMLIVVASYYALFAAIGGPRSAFAAEGIGFAIFAGMAVTGFRTSLWLVVAGLAAHALFDFFRGGLIANNGVPIWWPEFCLAYDLVAAACLAALIAWPRRRIAVRV